MRVEVRLSESMDRLVVVPRPGVDQRAVKEALQTGSRGLRLRHCPVGFEVAAQDVDRLPEVVTGVELVWKEEAKLFVDNRRRAKTNGPRLRQEVEDIKRGGPAYAARLIADLDGIERLDPHQVVTVAAMTLPGGHGMCVFDEQGAGKTVTFIFAFDLLAARDEADIALVVAPKSMVPEWQTDLARFKGDLYKSRILTGSRASKFAALASGADFFITNFETAVGMEEELSLLLRRYGGRAVLAVDESFFIKNLDARRTKALRRLREWCGRAYVLCGTPAPNSPHDVIQQFNLVDFGLTFDGIAIPKDHAAARPLVQGAIEQRGVFVRHLKKEVLPHLPGKAFRRVLVPMQPQQARAYIAALDDLIIDLRATDEQTFQRQITSFMDRRMKLLQICSNPTTLIPGYQEDPAKLLALESLLDELIVKRQEKVVLWSFFRASIDALVQRFARFLPIRYDGEVTDVSARREGVRAFQEDGDRMLFVGNPAAAGAGLTLHRARFAVYESLSNQAAHYLQSLDRVHRRGQARDVEYIVLLCDKTIELAGYETLTRKERAAQMLLWDPVDPPVTRDVFLSEALRARDLLES